MPIALTLASLIVAGCSKTEAPAPTTRPGATATAQAASSAVFSSESVSALDRYESLARELATSIEAGTAQDELNAPITELVGIATTILPEFVQARPDCRDYLEKAAELNTLWSTLSIDEIETGYHKDEALPKVENGAACYHVKDLIVHPISARALLAHDDTQRAEAKHEIDEVVAHIAVVKALTR